MQVMVDTNILLDYCDSNRVPFHTDCMAFLQDCVKRDVNIIISAASLNDVYYVLAKRYNEPFARQSIIGLLDLFEVVPLLVAQAREAAHSDEPDFEDGLIRAVAQSNNCDALITRDAAAFTHATVPAMSPAKWLETSG